MTKISSKTKSILLLLPFFLWLTTGCNPKSKGTDETPTFDVATPVKSVQLILTSGSTPVMQNIVSIFTQRVQERCPAKVSTSDGAELKIELVIKLGVGIEGYTFANGTGGTIQIIGNDQRGVIYGVGKFLRISGYGKDGFSAANWRGTSVPEKPLRGMYLANHADNYYQAAPVAEIQHYIEDLALWGVNNLLFVRAGELNSANRLKQFMLTAKGLEMSIGFLVEGNEGEWNSPAAIRCDPSGGRGAIGPSYICPNKPGGLDYILKLFSTNFDFSKDVQPDFLCIWPYDAGGYGTADCYPWGSNGFIKCVNGISKIAREKVPGIKIIISTWYFDATEWNGLSRQLAEDHSWVDMAMAEDIPGYETSFLPALGGNLPTVSFPEISMYNTFPWGGFGPTPLPKHILGNWSRVKNKYSGGFPYSEGIFDDITKVVYTQLNWTTQTTTDKIIKEYIAWEYSPEVVNEMLTVITTLEQNHHYRWWPGELDGVPLAMDWFPSKGVAPKADPGAEEAYTIVKQVDAKLPEWAQKSWRWRLVFIRTMLDAELKANGGSPNATCIDGFKELMRIYHTIANTDPSVKPPISGTGN